jgi:hypothetical protein
LRGSAATGVPLWYLALVVRWRADGGPGELVMSMKAGESLVPSALARLFLPCLGCPVFLGLFDPPSWKPVVQADR